MTKYIFFLQITILQPSCLLPCSLPSCAKAVRNVVSPFSSLWVLLPPGWKRTRHKVL